MTDKRTRQEPKSAGARVALPRQKRFRYRVVCYLFILPNLALFLLLTAFPVLFTAILSFFSWNGKDLDWARFRFVGLDNFAEFLRSGDFWLYFSNTLFLMLAIPVSILIHLVVAIVMNQKLKEMVAYRTLWFLPSVAGGVAILLLWQWVFNPHAGMLNTLLRPFFELFGISTPLWLQSETYGGAKFAFMIMGWWSSAGGMGMLLYLAALQGIPQGLYDAAEIDGAGWWSKLRHVTWPMVSPTTFFMFITGVIAGFQSGFISAYVLTKGGPNGLTTTLSFYIYQQAYENWRMGYASAICWFLFACVLIFTIISWKVARRRVHYQ